MKFSTLMSLLSFVPFLICGVCGCKKSSSSQHYSFSYSAQSFTPDAAIEFQSNAPDGSQFNWDFGDGSTSINKTPIHSYTSTGTFAVSLVVNNDKGQTVTNSINIFSVYMTGAFSLGGTISAGYPQIFAAHGALSTAKDSWDFGDGTKSNEQTPGHTYLQAGNYTVILCVNGDTAHPVRQPITVRMDTAFTRSLAGWWRCHHVQHYGRQGYFDSVTVMPDDSFYFSYSNIGRLEIGSMVFSGIADSTISYDWNDIYYSGEENNLTYNFYTNTMLYTEYHRYSIESYSYNRYDSF